MTVSVHSREVSSLATCEHITSALEARWRKKSLGVAGLGYRYTSTGWLYGVRKLNACYAKSRRLHTCRLITTHAQRITAICDRSLYSRNGQSARANAPPLHQNEFTSPASWHLHRFLLVTPQLARIPCFRNHVTPFILIPSLSSPLHSNLAPC